MLKNQEFYETLLIVNVERSIRNPSGVLQIKVSTIFVAFFLSSAATELELPFFRMSRGTVAITVKFLKIASFVLLLVGIALYFNIGTHLYHKEHRQNWSIGKGILSGWFCN